MHYETGLLVLVFVVLALVIGATLRDVLRSSRIPYSVALLVIGLGLGLAQRSGFFASTMPLLDHSLSLVADIDPHLILFLFLPTLIFESAFALEVHLFRRIFPQIALLAIPGLIVATGLTAAVAKYAFPWDWSWALCLMFGALISATDPVAVVALLKELSSRKRLETLIEGESLFNDGTAIVFFALFYSWVTAPEQADASFFSISWDFIRVVSLGLIVGVAFGAVAISWIGRVFNDPMLEITLSVAVAYLAFFVAESMHASGVVAVVVLALMFASIGRTKISPEVGGFLHHFWEMMAHIANTIIFLLVGTLIAKRIELDNVDAWIALGVLYISIQIIRSFSVTLFMPILKRIGIGITKEKAIVLVWGGLRGAVSLALALTVVQGDLIPKETADLILFLCAGIVVLTILVNGTSMAWLLKKLDLDRLPAAKQATVDKAHDKVLASLSDVLPEMMDDEFLKGADWDQVKVNAGYRRLNAAVDETNNGIDEADLTVAFRRRLLETERKHYWLQFEQGTLGVRATNKLVESVEHALDGTPTISPRPDLEKFWQTPPLLNTLKNISGMKKLALTLSFRRLALGYDVARGLIQAQYELGSHIRNLAPNDAEAEAVESLVEENKTKSLQYIERLRETFPEIIQSIETHSASRLLLYRERAVISQQLKKAVLDTPEAERMIMDVEERMAKLNRFTQINLLGDDSKLVGTCAWMQELPESTREKLKSGMEHAIYNNNEIIAKQGSPLNAIGVITRGTVQAERTQTGKIEKILYGPGETIAALSMLSGNSQETLKALTLVDILWLSGETLKSMMAKDPVLAKIVGRLMA